MRLATISDMPLISSHVIQSYLSLFKCLRNISFVSSNICGFSAKNILTAIPFSDSAKFWVCNVDKRLSGDPIFAVPAGVTNKCELPGCNTIEAMYVPFRSLIMYILLFEF